MTYRITITAPISKVRMSPRYREQSDGTVETYRFIWDQSEPVATRPLVFNHAAEPSAYYTHDGNKNVSELVHDTWQTNRGGYLTNDDCGVNDGYSKCQTVYVFYGDKGLTPSMLAVTKGERWR